MLFTSRRFPPVLLLALALALVSNDKSDCL